MSDHSISQVRSSNTRTSDGKKVDTWRVDLPDGASQITVMLHSSSNAIHFSAKGDHPCLNGHAWEGSDLAMLRNEVMADVEKAARRYFKDDWAPAIALSASLYKTDRGAEQRVQLSLDIGKIYIDPSRAVGNQGETHILSGRTPTVMLQRSHDQTFESDNTLSNNNMLYAREQGNVTSRVIVSADDHEAVQVVANTIESFSVKLMRRMAPDVVRIDGVPDPEDLVALMRAAIDDPEGEPDRDPEEFRM